MLFMKKNLECEVQTVPEEGSVFLSLMPHGCDLCS